MTNSKIIDLNLTELIIILNENGLTTTIKRQGLKRDSFKKSISNSVLLM